MEGTRFDIHRHALPEAILDRLASRVEEPRSWNSRRGTRLLQVPGGAPWPVPSRYVSPPSDDLIGIHALSPALGLDQLPASEQLEATRDWHAFATERLTRDAWWAHLPSVDLAAATEAIDDQLDDGAVGLVVPAAHITSAPALEALGTILVRCARRDRAVFVHPAAAPPSVVTRSIPGWDAVTDYVAQMHAAWCAWQAWGRPRHPDLRIAFAMGAGLAPLHADRLFVRTGIEPSVDPNQYVELSGVGPVAAGALAGVVAPGTLVWGSDSPVADVVIGPMHATASVAPRRLLGEALAEVLEARRAPQSYDHAWRNSA